MMNKPMVARSTFAESPPRSGARSSAATEFILESKRLIRERLALSFVDLQSFVLLDFPDHDNVGDSAIWLGETKYFRDEHATAPRYVCTFDTVDHNVLAAAPASEIIVLHGGGNFGDIWPAFQKFREDILVKYPQKKIVQMPQTLHYQNLEGIRRSAVVINQHPDFTMYVRDQPSYELATTHFTCKVFLCPDMAFYLGALDRKAPITQDILLLLRTDCEKNDAFRDEQNHAHRVTDWPNPIHNKFVRARVKLLNRLKCFTLGVSAHQQQLNYYEALAGIRVGAGLKLLSSAKYVIVDRLHAHILATLLDVPQTVLDNNYGKISRYVSAWEAKRELRIATNLAAAITDADRRVREGL